MSQYEDQYDYTDCVCPYCRNSYQVECEDFSEDLREEECDSCGAVFLFRQSFSVTHITTPDCTLNGDEHQYLPVLLRDGAHDFCAVCGKCRPFEPGDPFVVRI